MPSKTIFDLAKLIGKEKKLDTSDKIFTDKNQIKKLLKTNPDSNTIFTYREKYVKIQFKIVKGRLLHTNWKKDKCIAFNYFLRPCWNSGTHHSKMCWSHRPNPTPLKEIRNKLYKTQWFKEKSIHWKQGAIMANKRRTRDTKITETNYIKYLEEVVTPDLRDSLVIGIIFDGARWYEDTPQEKSLGQELKGLLYEL